MKHQSARLLPARPLVTGLLAVAALFPPVHAAAQFTAAPAKVLSLPASARAMALGGAYMMNSGHADALFHHPALLVGASGFGLEVQRWSGAATSSAASAAMAWLGGGVGIGLQTLQAGLAENRVPDSQDPLFTLGPLPLSERVATVGYARRLFGVQVGMAGKLVEERLGGTSSATVLLDVGVARALGPVTLGLTVHDVGRDPFESGGDYTPARVTLGAGSYGKPLGPLDVGLAAFVSHGTGETRVGGGVEIGYWPVSGRTLVARSGIQTVPNGSDASPLTLGAAFWGDDLTLEWAWQGFSGPDAGTHRFGVRWR